jgi:membrane protease YdiL (CAAX protease family)
MIRQDPLSKFLTLFAISELAIMAIIGGDLLQPTIVAVVLLISGFLFSDKFAKLKEDEEIDSGELIQTGVYVVLAIAVFAFLNFAVPNFGLGALLSNVFKLSNIITLSAAPASFFALKLYNVLIAISEEQFFRALFGNVFVSRLGSVMGSFVNGFWFMLFHIPRYANNLNALVIVLFAGMILTFIDLRTERVSTSMIAHIINNLLAG